MDENYSMKVFFVVKSKNVRISYNVKLYAILLYGLYKAIYITVWTGSKVRTVTLVDGSLGIIESGNQQARFIN